MAVATPSAPVDPEAGARLAREPGSGSRFHACPPAPGCPHCAGAGAAPAARFGWSGLDAVYCISLTSRPDRAAEAARELHRVGLCALARFHRPERHPRSPRRGIWQAHRDVASEALARAHARVLILEDDVLFRAGFSARDARRIGAALARLPAGWLGFYLGHWPLAAHFAGWRILRSASLCTHAYVASRGLLEWLAATPFAKTGIPRSRIGGLGIDSAFAALPGMYAYFPMVAVQRDSPHDHVRLDRPRRLRARLRDRLLARGMRASELAAVALSPLVWAARAARALAARARPARVRAAAR